MTTLAIVGFGKIARDQHLPALSASDRFDLIAVASRHSSLDGVDNYPDIDTLLTEQPALEAVSLCTPPQGRYQQALAAIEAGRHVMLEKPPGITLSEVEDLARRAQRAGVTLFTSWHARAAAGVEPARDWLAERHIRKVDIEWREDVRHWHPGQQWIWEPGGLGVFDPGINALSIVTHMLPQPFFLSEATLEVPENCQSPIAARLNFTDALQTPIHADFDWRQTGPQTWRITVVTDDGTLVLDDGGSRLTIGDDLKLDGEDVEYAGLYRRFAELIERGESEVDITPFRHVADAFMLARRQRVEAFIE
ncbi:Gfo/Idh/MocA family protein [Kushneria aurantia]|uniref:Gfo/Idh/MocA family protein n=1 Tax=Kushneria aurantia TaxID=504092 RepID=A0ABV6G164_9GAMM|nr:Gfo/Idh/MocA family oxidoreductase [Kushneria aurantia]